MRVILSPGAPYASWKLPPSVMTQTLSISDYVMEEANFFQSKPIWFYLKILRLVDKPEFCDVRL